jgi:hypothetical protein
MPASDRRAFLASLAAGVAAASVPLGAHGESDLPSESAAGQAPAPRAVAAPAFSPLPLGAIRPDRGHSVRASSAVTIAVHSASVGTVEIGLPARPYQ